LVILYQKLNSPEPIFALAIWASIAGIALRGQIRFRESLGSSYTSLIA